MTAPLLEFAHVTKLYGRGRFAVRALHDISFTLAGGRTLAIVGESGSGKTTLARLALGIDFATEGEIRIAGNAIGRKFSLADRRNIQLVQQNPFLTLNPARTIGQAIAVPLRLHFGQRGNRARTRIAELLNLVGISADLIDRLPRNLSGGQRQRIALARALA